MLAGITEYQTLNVDTVSSASITSTSVLDDVTCSIRLVDGIPDSLHNRLKTSSTLDKEERQNEWRQENSFCFTDL